MEKQGLIFNIQKFSLHDGPGIRTVVFLKGCPLRCKWCSNPESQITGKQVLWDKSKCTNCLKCINSCSHHGISFVEGRIHIDDSQCVACGLCISTCPGNALKMEGEYRSVDDVLNVCMQDYDFYMESGGGVTVSGGEGMIYPDFVIALNKKLREKGIHTAIETTGYVESDIFNRVADHLDLLLFDVKHYDRDKHFEGTGVYNDLIIRNLKNAITDKRNILPRIPVIPGFNSSVEDAAGLSDLLLSAGAERVQLLPFHQFGEKKYEMLNMRYELGSYKALYPEDLQDYQKVFMDKGIDCFF